MKVLYSFNKRGFEAIYWPREINAASCDAISFIQFNLGVNAHLRGKYTVGNYRMSDLPANGVMQITDGGEYVQNFYESGRELENADELIGKLDYFLTHPDEREEIARAGYRCAMTHHRIGKRLQELHEILSPALSRRNLGG